MMTILEKEIISEDLEFICDYISDVINKHPEILEENPDFVKKIDRRINDILKRIGI